MGLLRRFKKYILTGLLLVATAVPVITAHAGYSSWDQVPADKKENAKAFFLSLREEGGSKDVRGWSVGMGQAFAGSRK